MQLSDMSQFWFYFGLGKSYIMDINSVQHILFVVAVCAVYLLKDWRKVLILLLFFTFGYSLTLILTALNVINVKPELIRYLIPVTIFITAFSNILKKQSTYYKKNLQSNYFLAMFFGLIHGVGFAHYLKNILVGGKPTVTQLLAYNLGIELAHIIIIFLFLLASYIFVNLINVSRRDWNLVISSGIAGIAITIMFEAKYW
jgi:hypothetical protein